MERQKFGSDKPDRKSAKKEEEWADLIQFWRTFFGKKWSIRDIYGYILARV
jgi:hypothetical protein